MITTEHIARKFCANVVGLVAPVQVHLSRALPEPSPSFATLHMDRASRSKAPTTGIWTKRWSQERPEAAFTASP